MAATTAFNHPAKRLDLLVDATGLHKYLEMNREHRIRGAGFLDEAAKMLWEDLKNKPGDTARRALLGVDHKIMLRRMCNHIRTAAAYDETAAKHLAAAWGDFLAMYGEPGAVRKTRGFDPTK